MQNILMTVAEGETYVRRTDGRGMTLVVTRGWTFAARPCWVVESTNLLGTVHSAATRRECLDTAIRMLSALDRVVVA